MSAALAWLQGLFKAAQPVVEAVEKADPALKLNVTLAKIMQGVTAANRLPWAGIGKTLADRFSDPAEAALTVEEVAKAVAPLLPEAIYVADIAAVIVMLAQLGVIRQAPKLTPEQAHQVARGINPFSGAPLFT